MLTAIAVRELTTEGLIEEAEFGIDPEQVAHIMGILRSSLYTKKPLAVMREYSSNGWDSHRMCGKDDVPLHITLPTTGDPTFKCRDFGPGLSRVEVLLVYTKYGKSTKRGAKANCPDCAALRDVADIQTGDPIYCETCTEAVRVAKKSIGTLGIGSKSGFCMGDTFTITSWHDGMKSVYVAALDKSNKGKMSLIHEEECPPDETGIEVKVAVPGRMVFEFEQTAQRLFRYMRPQPKINTSLRALPIGLPGGSIHPNKNATSDWIGVMGCVPYRIDLEHLKEPLMEEGLFEPLSQLSGAVYIPIGEVEFAANREELQYTEATIKAIVARFKVLVQDYIDDAITTISTEKDTGWSRRLKANFLANDLKFPLPRTYKKWSARQVPIYAKEIQAPTGFQCFGGGKEKKSTRNVTVHPEAAICLHDPKDKRTLKGWATSSLDLIVAAKDGKTREQVRADLEMMLAPANLDGVRVIDLESERSWYQPRDVHGRSQANQNIKHRQHTFKLVGTDQGSILSKNWEKVEPTSEDHIFVIIASFKVDGITDFYGTVSKDRAMAKRFGLTYPETIYGYKTTAKRPIKPEDIQGGTPYKKWRRTFFRPLMTPTVQARIRDLAWSNLFQNIPYRYRHGYSNKIFKNEIPSIRADFEDRLGKKHPVSRYFACYQDAVKRCRKINKEMSKDLFTLSKMFPGRNKKSAPVCALDRIIKMYPMLGIRVNDDGNIWVFMIHKDTIIQYISDKDRENDMETTK